MPCGVVQRPELSAVPVESSHGPLFRVQHGSPCPRVPAGNLVSSLCMCLDTGV